MRLPAAALLTTMMLLGACASGPPAPPARPPQPATDGPPERVPPGLAQRPDAVPRVEPFRVGGPNKPYAVAGVRYTPLTTDAPLRERGGASWYGRKFHGQPTASGEIYDMFGMTAAHRTMPLPSYARVRNPANGRQIIVRINDRGPFHPDRAIDLSYTAALKLGLLGGVATVEVERITHAEIRAQQAQ
jgi:rare lipoprotein A